MKRLMLILMIGLLFLSACASNESSSSISRSSSSTSISSSSSKSIVSTTRTESTETTKLLYIDIVLSLDTQNYTISSNQNEYQASIIPDRNYNYIIIEIVLNNKNSFSSSSKVIINEKEIKETNYELKGDILTIKIPDPNWSGIY